MAKIQITLTLEPTALYQYHRPDTGLTVYAYNADLNSGADVLLTESGVSGVYKNSSVDAGAYQVYIGGTHSTGVRYTQFEPLIAEEISKEGMKDASISDDKLVNASVTEDKIATGAVTVNKIGAAAVTEAKIGTGAVTEDKIGAAAVTEAKIEDAAVTEDKIGAAAVTEAKIEDAAVTEDKIGAAAVTIAKIKSSDISESGTASTIVKRTAAGDVQGADLRAAETIELSTNGAAIIRKYQAVMITGMSGESDFDITFDETAAGDKVLGVCLRVNVALGQTWGAAYSEPSAQVIAASGIAAAVNTKLTRLYDSNANIAINKLGNTIINIAADSGTFDSGSVTAVLFYERLAELLNYGA
jgi:hypothetical protein